MNQIKSWLLPKLNTIRDNGVRNIPHLISAMIREHGLYRYRSYDEYKRIQIDTNTNKINNCWATECDIELLSNYLIKNVPNPTFGICHGTRRGREQEWFRERLNIDVIGTEISPTAAQFPHTIEWDFHDVKEEWVGNVDFIYSNSFDHSFDPAACLDAWMSCINSHGVCILEWTRGHRYPSKSDPFGGGFEYYKTLIRRKYTIKDVITGCYDHQNDLERFFFVISRRKV